MFLYKMSTFTRWSTDHKHVCSCYNSLHFQPTT